MAGSSRKRASHRLTQTEMIALYYKEAWEKPSRLITFCSLMFWFVDIV